MNVVVLKNSKGSLQKAKGKSTKVVDCFIICGDCGDTSLFENVNFDTKIIRKKIKDAQLEVTDRYLWNAYVHWLRSIDILFSTVPKKTSVLFIPGKKDLHCASIRNTISYRKKDLPTLQDIVRKHKNVKFIKLNTQV